MLEVGDGAKMDEDKYRVVAKKSLPERLFTFVVRVRGALFENLCGQ